MKDKWRRGKGRGGGRKGEDKGGGRRGKLLILFSWQVLYQAVIVTDGKASFAIFLFGNLHTLNVFSHYTGFSSGDRRRFTNIGTLNLINIFRIDGKENISMLISACLTIK